MSIEIRYRNLLRNKASVDEEEIKIRHHIAMTFRNWMEAEGLSHARAANRIGVNKSTLSTWVRLAGEKRSSIANMILILNRYNLNKYQP